MQGNCWKWHAVCSGLLDRILIFPPVIEVLCNEEENINKYLGENVKQKHGGEYWVIVNHSTMINYYAYHFIFLLILCFMNRSILAHHNMNGWLIYCGLKMNLFRNPTQAWGFLGGICFIYRYIYFKLLFWYIKIL